MHLLFYLTVFMAATYPREVALEAVDVQQGLLGIDIGIDGEEVLWGGGRMLIKITEYKGA